MSVEGVLARGRAAALQLMRDACTVERKSGAPALDQSSGLLVQAWVSVYAGVCRVKAQGQGAGAEFGEHEVTLHQYVAVLPWNATPVVKRQDRLTVTASDDEWLIGRHLEVIAISLAGTSTARRVLVEDKEG